MNSLDINDDKDLDLDIDLQEAEVIQEAEVSEAEVSETDEIVDDELKDKKTETEVIDDYLKPNSRCILCTTPIWSVRLNRAFLDGETYKEIIEKLSSKFEERTGRTLNKSLLHRHFTSHFDARAAAISQYNKRRRTDGPSYVSPTVRQRDIFKLTTQKYLDELELFDTTAKEMITKYKELEDIIEEKRNNGKSFGIDDLILKQAQILNVLNKQSISKFKALSKVDLESKQGQFLSQLNFINGKAGPNDKKSLVSPKETEEIYLGVVIKQVLARLDDPLKSVAPDISVDQKALFYRELKKSIEGIQDGINADFERQLKSKQQKLITDKNDSTH
jgi:hypothetical protein